MRKQQTHLEGRPALSRHAITSIHMAGVIRSIRAAAAWAHTRLEEFTRPRPIPALGTTTSERVWHSYTRKPVTLASQWQILPSMGSLGGNLSPVFASCILTTAAPTGSTLYR